MTWLASVAAAVSLAGWLWLVLAHGRFWRAGERLAQDGPDPPTWPAVAAVIPARDEQAVIGRAIRSIAGQDYPGAMSIVVVDDGSRDGTADAARRAVSETVLTVLQGADLPAGWTGKLWAVSQGIDRADAIDPDLAYVWLTDADIEHAPGVLKSLVRKAEADDADLVSLMVRLRCVSFWERLLVPPLVFFFQKLYPFSRVNDPACATAAAAGGCMLVRRRALTRIGGIRAIRNALIDDCALARAIKADGRVWLGLTQDSHGIRAYDGLSGLWSMVARTAFHQLGYSTPMLFLAVLGMATLYGAPPLVVLAWPLHGDGFALLSGALACLIMGVAYAPTLKIYGRGPASALWLPVAAMFYGAMTIDSARRYWLGQGGAWKARTYMRQG